MPYTAGDLNITMEEIYLVAQYCLPVHGTVPRPLSSQYVYDNITLIQQPYDPRVAMNEQITIPWGPAWVTPEPQTHRWESRIHCPLRLVPWG